MAPRVQATAKVAKDEYGNIKEPGEKSPELKAAERQFAEHQAEPGPKRGSGDTVTVGCKMPSGLVLRVFDWVDTPEPVLGGGTRMAKMAREREQRYELKGYAVPFGASAARPIFGRYGLTNNIPRDFFELWLEQNKDSDLVKTGLVFMESSEDRARDHAKDLAKVRCGFETINTEARGPDKKYLDPRMPQRIKRMSENSEDMTA